MTDLTTLLTTWADAERAADASTTERLLTDDFVGVGPVGFQLSKQAWLQRQTGGDLHYDQLDLDEVATREYSDCAVTVGRWNARGTAQGRPIPEASRVTLVSVKNDGDWRIAGIHFSFIAGTPGAPGIPTPS
jgi:ketosteroid isomerase-like protein